MSDAIRRREAAMKYNRLLLQRPPEIYQDAAREQHLAMDVDPGMYPSPEPARQVQTRDGDAAAENDWLRAEIQRLQSDAKAVQGVLDDTFSELTVTQGQLSSTKSDLASAEQKCADLQATIDDLMANLAPSAEPLASTQTEVAKECSEHLQPFQTQGLQSTPTQLNARGPGEDSAEVAELQNQVRFFKANSERLTQMAGFLKDQLQQLNEETEMMRKELKNVLRVRAASAMV